MAELRAKKAASGVSGFKADVDRALTLLEDAVVVAEARGPGSDYEANTSLADDNSAVASIVSDIRKFSSKVGPQLRRLR